MKLSKKNLIRIAISVTSIFSFVLPVLMQAATTPPPGQAATYAILSSTYTNTIPGTTVNGDIGFSTGPAVEPLGVHPNYGSGGSYATGGVDQSNTLSNLNSQVCTFTFAPGAIDLATDTTHGPIGMYSPGVYCTSGAVSVGAAGITLSGSGTYIFRISGALTTVANSVVTGAGVSACDVFWTPTEATTLGANSTFLGTNIDPAGITVGATVGWIGRALAFGGTVTTGANDTITAPACAVPPIPVVPPVPIVPPVQQVQPAPIPATLRVIKQVVNNNGGTLLASAFNLHVKLSGIDVTGSPAQGTVTPGTSYVLSAGTYVVSEDQASVPYTLSFSGDCDGQGVVVLTAGSNKTCTLTNTDVAVVVPVVPPVISNIVTPVTPINVATPSLPITGFPPITQNSSWILLILSGLTIVIGSSLLVAIIKKEI